ncbi:aminodeoxychorismate lyase [Bacillus testis]|uniref:aminodeoxychorismate lyase n=1 Tax=Bacillus testis TaxID=1622072 RepID=UPI00067EA5EA|nr:aminodeoxychorismate lyase [Bacillus testis]
MMIYQNGAFIPEQDAAITPFDHGFLYGMGVFETFRIYNGHPFLLKDHLRRLQKSLDAMYIEYNVDGERIADIVSRLLSLNGLKNARVRLNISAGPGPVGLQKGPYLEPNILVFMSGLPPAPEQLIERQAKILELRRNSPEQAYRLKSHHYGNNMAATRELAEEEEGIYLNREGMLAEAVTSNLFWVQEGILYTPNLETGILPGITRQFILEMAKRLGIPYKEGFYPLEKLSEAEEVFLTNSVQEIVPISRIKGVGVYRGSDGEMVQRLYDLYKAKREELLEGNAL